MSGTGKVRRSSASEFAGRGPLSVREVQEERRTTLNRKTHLLKLN